MLIQYYNSFRKKMNNVNPSSFEKKVFISYARKDKELINLLLAQVRTETLNTGWIKQI